MTRRRFRRSAAALIAGALALAAVFPAVAQAPRRSEPADAAPTNAASDPVADRLSTIEARLERIAVALEQQLDLARLDLIVRRVESGERRLDDLEGSRAQASSYLLTLRERRATVETALAEAEEQVRTGWPPGPREEAVGQRDQAEEVLSQVDAEIEAQETSIAELDARAARLRQEIEAWSRLLEEELEPPPIPAAEEAAEATPQATVPGP